MATNPFEDENKSYLVLINDEQQYSLWPAEIGVPAGWQVVLDASPRQSCVDHIDKHWTDMRPASIRGS